MTSYCSPLIRLIHRSAWNKNSRKFRFRIVHRSPSERREDGFCGPSSAPRGDYMLWCWMDIQKSCIAEVRLP
jgi:hypothetical protein